MNQETTKRSQLDADALTQVLRTQGVAQLLDEPELTLVMDGMEVRRPGAEVQQHRMRVKALNGGLVNGYRTVNVLGMGPDDARGLVYHRLFSSTAPDFTSENHEVRAAIDRTEEALTT